MVHIAALQFPRPEAAIEFDVDKSAAIATRRKFFAMAARERLLVAGMHLPFPGLGYVTQEPTGYAYHLAPWRLTL